MMRTIKSQVGTVILSLEARSTLRRADSYLQPAEARAGPWSRSCHKGTGPASLNSVCLGSSPRALSASVACGQDPGRKPLDLTFPGK